MHPRLIAERDPTRHAAIMAETGATLTYGALEREANRAAQLFRHVGLARGDTIATLLENELDYSVLYWAVQRSGLYLVPVPTRLTAAEVRYIVGDSGARLLIVSPTATAADTIGATLGGTVMVFAVGDPLSGARAWRDAIASMPDTPIADESQGTHMPYSSGTTGRPKGIRLPLVDEPVVASSANRDRLARQYGLGEDTVYLSPAPLYHSAPLVYCAAVQGFGGTAVIMRHFDAEAFLAAIERYRVTFTQVVPTMFVRLLKLPDAVRARYDLSSLRMIVHAAAPCPVAIKHRMIDWLGPIVYEYYSASEGIGATYIGPHEWLERPGSVGRAVVGTIHICDDAGGELAPGEIGTVYFASGVAIRYHNDPAKSSGTRHPDHPTWSTVGDIGRVDAEGYLFLSDRKAFMIISGGVNIYPQEAENVLIGHPAVFDAAVFGVPDDEFGEQVKAVVQTMPGTAGDTALAAELIRFCREHLSPIKCPRSIDFTDALPRQPNGKLFKTELRDRYWRDPPQSIGAAPR